MHPYEPAYLASLGWTLRLAQGRLRSGRPYVGIRYNRFMPIPEEFGGQKYLSLATFRKTGVPVRTPVWFVDDSDKLYLFTNPKSGKVKRIRNNPRVRIAPCTMRGKITGPEFEATARILSPSEAEYSLRLMKKKYWLMRIPFLWSKSSIFIELTMS